MHFASLTVVAPRAFSSHCGNLSFSGGGDGVFPSEGMSNAFAGSGGVGGSAAF